MSVMTVLGPVKREALGVTLAHEHLLIDLRNQAEIDIRAIQRSLSQVGQLLPPEDRARIEQAVAEVQALAAGNEPDPLHKRLDELGRMTARLAELSIKQVLTDEGGK